MGFFSVVVAYPSIVGASFEAEVSLVGWNSDFGFSLTWLEVLASKLLKNEIMI